MAAETRENHDGVEMSTSAPTQHDRHEDDEIHVPEKVHNTSNVDIGAQIVAGTVIEFDQVVMRRALWKIDLWVLPLLA